MSSDHIAIYVSHLGKQYRLGGPQKKHLTLCDATVNAFKAPMNAFHRPPPGTKDSGRSKDETISEKLKTYLKDIDGI
jgi:hypothetical protein